MIALRDRFLPAGVVAALVSSLTAFWPFVPVTGRLTARRVIGQTCLALMFASLLHGTADGWPATREPAAAQSPDEIIVKLMVVTYNPIIESSGNRRLNDVLGWNDPDSLTAQLVNDFRMFSHGVVNYQIVERVERDEWPLHASGLRYTDELYLQETAAHDWTLGPGDYNAIIADNRIAEKVNAGAVDEVFLWGFPGAGWFESAMAGDGAFWINGGPIGGVASKAFVLMGLNYERGLAEAAESYAHRTESIMRRVYGSWEPAETHDWNRFTLLDRDLPGRGGLGNAHNAFNSEPGTDYNRSSTRFVSTSADDWYNFPNMTGTRTDQNCAAWECDAYEYLKWWYDHMPHVPGEKEGILNNWWRFIVDPNQYKDTWRFLPGPEADLAADATDWLCSAEMAACALANDAMTVRTGSQSLRFSTTGAFDTWMAYPGAGDANWDPSANTHLTFWVLAQNVNSGGFQDSWVDLKNSDGSYFRYLLGPGPVNDALGEWRRVVIPLAGGGSAPRVTSGSPSLMDVDQIEVHYDTWGAGFTVYMDDLGFSSADAGDTVPPRIALVSPAEGATVSGTVPVRVDASDDFSVFRVELFVDGQYHSTDAISPYVFELDMAGLSAGSHAIRAVAYDAFENQAATQIALEIVPEEFALDQNRPNPFSRRTAIHFELPRTASIQLDVFDLQGRRTRVLATGIYPAGRHVLEWDGDTDEGAVARPGIYFCHMSAGSFRAKRKMVLLP